MLITPLHIHDIRMRSYISSWHQPVDIDGSVFQPLQSVPANVDLPLCDPDVGLVRQALLFCLDVNIN